MKRVNLIHGDCMELMANTPDKFYDLAICDPPYGIGAGNMTMGKGSRNDKGKNKLKTWDDGIPSEQYFKELIRVSNNQIIWGGNYFLDYLGAAKCFLLWDKMDYNSDFASHELAWTSFDKVVKCYRRARNMGDDNKIHPTQKPITLYKWLLHHYATPDMHILDTHLGSGSSAIAAHYFGCKFTGIEIDKDYYDAAVKRFDLVTSQQVMF